MVNMIMPDLGSWIVLRMSVKVLISWWTAKKGLASTRTYEIESVPTKTCYQPWLLEKGRFFDLEWTRVAFIKVEEGDPSSNLEPAYCLANRGGSRPHQI